MNLVRSCSEVDWHFDVLCGCVKHNRHYETGSRTPVDSLMTATGVGLVNDATPPSFKAAIPTPFPLYDRWGDILDDDGLLQIISRQWFDWPLFDFVQVVRLQSWLLPWVSFCLQFRQRCGVILHFLQRSRLLAATIGLHFMCNLSQQLFNEDPFQELPFITSVEN